MAYEAETDNYLLIVRLAKDVVHLQESQGRREKTVLAEHCRVGLSTQGTCGVGRQPASVTCPPGLVPNGVRFLDHSRPFKLL
jgi:hypothetical protein